MALSDFSVPGIHFFMSDNPFCGSCKGFNYCLIPRKAAEDDDEQSHLEVFVWYGMLCSEKAEKQAEAHFPLDTDGLAAAVRWLHEQDACYRQTLH